jgi:hypothetical protein
MRQSPQIWFAAKTYGWGWGAPVCWQGWLVLGAYIAAVALTSVYFPPGTHLLAYLLCMALATAALLAVCWLKGEPPAWRWGKR